MVQQSTDSTVNTVQKHYPTLQISASIKPLTTCWNCYSYHFAWNVYVRYILNHSCNPQTQRPTQSMQRDTVLWNPLCNKRSIGMPPHINIDQLIEDSEQNYST